MSQKYLEQYYFKFQNLFNDKSYFNKLEKIKEKIIQTKKIKKKIVIFGNGGSAAIASHFSVDLTKVAKVRCVNFNEYDLITCLSNDYGFENWMKMAIKFYLDKNDVLILISSSGVSKNVLKAANFAKKKGIYLITFTGFKKNNPLSKKGKINIWVNSKVYNHVENVHQAQLLSITDLIAKTKIN
tara:strand:+ start:1318 stop:1869 length:552 start_codon:yes stop_codon:yes gene_type:complete